MSNHSLHCAAFQNLQKPTPNMAVSVIVKVKNKFVFGTKLLCYHVTSVSTTPGLLDDRNLDWCTTFNYVLSTLATNKFLLLWDRDIWLAYFIYCLPMPWSILLARCKKKRKGLALHDRIKSPLSPTILLEIQSHSYRTQHFKYFTQTWISCTIQHAQKDISPTICTPVGTSLM